MTSQGLLLWDPRYFLFLFTAKKIPRSPSGIVGLFSSELSGQFTVLPFITASFEELV